MHALCRVNVMLIDAISAELQPVGCVTCADVDAACIPEGSCHASLSPLQIVAGKGWLHIDFWKTLGYGMANRVAESAPTPDRAGYPWASSLVCRRHAQPGKRRWVRA